MLEKEGGERDLSLWIGLILGLTAVVFWIRQQQVGAHVFAIAQQSRVPNTKDRPRTLLP